MIFMTGVCAPVGRFEARWLSALRVAGRLLPAAVPQDDLSSCQATQDAIGVASSSMSGQLCRTFNIPDVGDFAGGRLRHDRLPSSRSPK